MTIVRSRSFRAAIVLSSLMLSLAACGGEDEPANAGPASDAGPSNNPPGTPDPGNPVPPADGALVRVVHASADAPAVDVYVKGQSTPVVQNLAYGGTSAYLPVPPGAYQFEVRASPSTAADPAVYTTTSLELKVGDTFSAVAAGLLAGKEDASKFRVLAIHEDFGLAGADSAILRIVHAAPDAPSVGIDLHDNGAASPEIGNIDRFSASPVEGILLGAGKAEQIAITAGGKRVTAFTTPELPAGAQLLVIATGLLGSRPGAADGFGLLAVGPQGTIGFIRQNPWIYALHAGADAPAVDLFAGDAELVDDLSFGALSGPKQVPPGSYTVDFFPTAAGAARPAGEPAAKAAPPALAAGQEALLVATGLLAGTGNQSFRLLAFNDEFPVATQSKIRAVHASPDAPAVDLGVLNAEHVVNPVLFSNLTFGQASAPEGATASAGTLPLGVTPTGQSSTIAASFHVPVLDTTRAFAIAAGTLGTPNAQTFRLLVVDTAATPWTVATVDPQP